MAFHSVQCPSCNKEIQIPDDVDFSRCMYCGQSIVFKDTVVQVNVGPNITNLLGLARTAFVAGNIEEAGKYYIRVLELDPTISEAWIGKGKFIGWQSSIDNMRFGEMLIVFNHAIATASDREKDSTIQVCISEVNKLVVKFYGEARHLLQLREKSYPDDPTWVYYVDRTKQLVSVLENIAELNKTDKTTLENIVHLCKDLIEGAYYINVNVYLAQVSLKFKNPASSSGRDVWHLVPQDEAVIRHKFDATVKKLQDLDPSYKPPVVNVAQAIKPDPTQCFVVTATMGSSQHPTVNLMRRFRDQWILQQKGGQKFVMWYYRHGPRAAILISRSRWLRALSFITIVAPIAWIARRLVK